MKFDLSVTAPSPQTVALSVTNVPQGWGTTLRGGGFVIGAVTAAADKPGSATLEVRVPPDTAPGTYGLTVEGTGAAGSATLGLVLNIQTEVNGGIGVAADFPSLQGDPTSTFTYTLTITNNTPSQQTFSFAPRGPQGWTVTASPTAQSKANTVTIDAGSTSQVSVNATPPTSAQAGSYPITVAVTAGNGASGQIQLTAVVTGTAKLGLATADQRLNTSGQANHVKRLTLVISNTGTAPLTDVSLSATPPTDWQVTFDPTSVKTVAPNGTAQVTAVIKPAKNAVAGDYAIGVHASAGSNSADLALRYSVKGTRLLGVAGIAIILVALGGLGAVYMRFGRR